MWRIRNNYRKSLIVREISFQFQSKKLNLSTRWFMGFNINISHKSRKQIPFQIRIRISLFIMSIIPNWEGKSQNWSKICSKWRFHSWPSERFFRSSRKQKINLTSTINISSDWIPYWRMRKRKKKTKKIYPHSIHLLMFFSRKEIQLRKIPIHFFVKLNYKKSAWKPSTRTPVCPLSRYPLAITDNILLNRKKSPIQTWKSKFQQLHKDFIITMPSNKIQIVHPIWNSLK